MNPKDKLIDFFVNIYCKIFNTKKSKEQKIFIENLFYVFIATGIAKGLFLIINILGGRLLGETTYGEYTLIVSLASFLMIPIGFGVIGGLIKQLADKEKHGRKKRIVSTAVNFYVITAIIVTVIYLLFYKTISSLVNIGSNLVLLAIVLAIFWRLSAFSESFLLGLHKQKKWSIFTIIAYIISFGIFAAFILTNNINILFIYFPTLGTYIFLAIPTMILGLKYYSIKIFDKVDFKEMMSFGSYVFIVGIATTFLGNVDKLMLNYFLGSAAVGTYQAYHFSSIMVVGVITGIFVKVFFPTAIKKKDPVGILKKIDRMHLISTPFIIIFLPFLIYLIIYLYNYDFFIVSTILFTIATVVDSIVVTNSTLLQAQGTKAMKKITFGVMGAFIINVPLNYFLIQIFGVNGAIIATILSFFTLLVWIRINLKKYK